MIKYKVLNNKKMCLIIFEVFRHKLNMGYVTIKINIFDFLPLVSKGSTYKFE